MIKVSEIENCENLNVGSVSDLIEWLLEVNEVSLDE
jgi:hypothetical protein